MFTKTTFDDEAGNKRLTSAGHVAVALALGSFVTAIALFGLKTVSDQQAVDAQAQKDALAEEATKAKNFRDKLRDLQAEEDRRIAAADRRTALAETRAARAEQRLLIATTAREQRERDQELARDVNRGTSRNLELTRQALVKSDAALTQLQRLLSPISSIKLDVWWDIQVPFMNTDGYDNAFAGARTECKNRIASIASIPLSSDDVCLAAFQYRDSFLEYAGDTSVWVGLYKTRPLSCTKSSLDNPLLGGEVMGEPEIVFYPNNFKRSWIRWDDWFDTDKASIGFELEGAIDLFDKFGRIRALDDVDGLYIVTSLDFHSSKHETFQNSANRPILHAKFNGRDFDTNFLNTTTMKCGRDRFWIMGPIKRI
jgi:hypothetical protein